MDTGALQAGRSFLNLNALQGGHSVFFPMATIAVNGNRLPHIIIDCISMGIKCEISKLLISIASIPLNFISSLALLGSLTWSYISLTYSLVRSATYVLGGILKNKIQLKIKIDSFSVSLKSYIPHGSLSKVIKNLYK